MSERVLVEREGEVAWLRFLSGLSLNVITLDLLGRFHAALDAIERDPPRVLMICGADGAFSGGADLSVMRAMSEATYEAFVRSEYRLFRRLDQLPFVTIAVIGGVCIGNAAELTLACDLRVVAQGMRWGLPEIKVGFPAPAQRIRRYLGIGRAKELLYGGRVLDGDAALALGLATVAVEDGELMAEARRMAERAAAYAPLATRFSKAALSHAYDLDMDFDAEELDSALAAFRSADFQEGADAALGRRRAVFQGR